jgi:monoamine oxidase
MPTTKCDVAILGAGVAGLAAMRLLEQRGIHTHVLEARDRIGGRIHTMRDPRVGHPIELGAEFVHGSAPEVQSLAQDARLLLYSIGGQRWRPRGRRLERLRDFWKRLDTVMRHLDSEDEDRSFAEFLADAPGGPHAGEARALAHDFVEGFHAADATRVSVLALAEGGSPEGDPEEKRQMRLADGYDQVPEWLAQGLEDRIETESVVERVEWTRDGVSVWSRRAHDLTSTIIEARAAIVTVPLGVLLAPPGEPGAITFAPPLPILDRAPSRLAMGSVVRVNVLFRERWWTERLRAAPKDASLASMSFLHGDSDVFPVWWSQYPMHTPVLIGWTGGPAALRLSQESADEIQGLALKALASNLRVTRQRVASQVEAFWMHDWQGDPFARGGYSYALVGGAEFASRLARPIERVIWIAGEAADPEGANGTVHGAIGSGRKAGLAVAKALGRAKRSS